nr:TVP38/TMEM64 family protein [Alkalicoccus halolimnae]
MKINKIMVFKIFAVLIIFGGLLWINSRFINVTPEALRNFIEYAGWFAPFLYIIIYTFRPLILFPASILSLAGGLLFGPAAGTVLILIGATAGAALSFIIARKLGKNIAGKEWTGRAAELQRQLTEHGFVYVVLIRLVPVFNFDFISYLCGISKLRIKAFIFGTFIGIIPGAFAYSFLGSSLIIGDREQIVAAIIIFLAVSTIPLLFRKKISRKFNTSKEER